jgi:hypothetical protein
MANMLVSGATSFYLLRLPLGVLEAGFSQARFST